MAELSLSAVVVNYRRRELLSECLDSLRAALLALDDDAEMIVVDNGSGDGSVELVAARFPEAKVVALAGNRGFAAGVNAGLRRSKAEWVLLLNNDATLERSAPRELLDAGRSATDIGSVACQLRFRGSSVINSAGIGIDRLGVAYDRLLGQPASASEARPVEVFGTSAGAGLYRRAMLDELGGFDESFFVYLEDADLAWRARMSGWRSLYAPAAIAHHRYSATSRHGSSFKYFHAGLNRVRMLAKNADRRQLSRYGPAIVAYDLAYVVAVAAWDRTLAPLRGRLKGVLEWSSYRRSSRGRRPVELAPPRGIRGALARRATWTEHAAGAVGASSPTAPSASKAPERSGR